MADHQPEAVAAWLHAEHEGRIRHRRIEPWPMQPDEPFAYAVQDEFLAQGDTGQRGAVVGYKIGLTTPRMQKLCCGDRPISGVMFSSGIRHSPVHISLGDFVHLGIESELAIRLARPLPRNGRQVTRADVAEAVGEVAAAFELIEDRHADYATLDWLWMAAENSWHAGLVLAAAQTPRDSADLAGVLEIDGKEVDRGSTRDVLGHPLDAVAWLANHLHARGQQLEAGHWISTGSIATIRFPTAGQSYRFTIAGLPPVELMVTS